MGGCIVCTAIRLLLLIIPLFFFLYNVQKVKIFVTFFTGTVRPRKFKLGTLVNNGWIYRVYQNQAAAAYLSLYFFIFLSLQLSNINIFVTLFSGTMRPRKLKHGTPVDNRCMYLVYRNLAAAAYCPFIGPFFFLSCFQLQICLSSCFLL